MNGTNVAGGGVLSLNPGAGWRAIGAGDFNGDGHATSCEKMPVASRTSGS
jgi:hypothetical protein